MPGTLKWWEIAFTLRTAEDALATHARGIEKLAPFMLALSGACLVAGLVLPIVQVSSLFIFSDRVSVVSGLYALWQSSEYFIAVVIAAFSIALPITKILIADYVWRGCSHVRARQGRSIGILEWVGRWSMLDVLVIALIVISLKSSMLGDARGELGIYFFTVSVICSASGLALIKRTLKRITNSEATPRA